MNLQGSGKFEVYSVFFFCQEAVVYEKEKGGHDPFSKRNFSNMLEVNKIGENRTDCT